ncbi:cbb3-type cytochrome c oxidase N-terminal domain-containing protein [Pontibacter sp. G13]|uniref:cbb3-type cytochrome c oxidase N-terminal domain-containing protein n=1 Tax=Pontibacter sp. G13 TaxID=3074898 RepID=UPI0028899D07|nr:cbb3-type cytochrome c oxidase N-terminal domain-containing protein [Pontibacter sp. G13]WNJ16110.1 cbb3-type cytochrome c oxidase N-terminal domain-containing protein [Pontibacter sp. G13]
MKYSYRIPLLLGMLGMLVATPVAAADMEGVSQSDFLYIMLFTMIALAVVILQLSIVVFTLIRKDWLKQQAPEGEAAKAPEISFWKRLEYKLTDAVPVAKESAIEMDHEYDGIRELDNNLPPWWKYGFYVTIVIGIFYFYGFHFAGSWSSQKEYETEMAVAEEAKQAYLASLTDLVDESNVVALTDAGDLSKGKSLFAANCVACHGQMGEGGIGPNLTDEYWIHGGDIKNVFTTIKYGVLEKGMTAWEATFSPGEMQQVASYVLSLKGTNPPNAKDPQGDLYVPEEQPESDSTAVSGEVQASL